MAAFLEAVADHIIASGEGTEPHYDIAPDEGVYVNRMPEEADNGILLFNRLPGSRVDYSTQTYMRTRFLIVCRGTNMLETVQKAHRVAALMKLDSQPETKYGVLFHELYAESSPEVYPRSQGDYIEVGLTVRAAYVSDGTYNP